MKNVPICSDAQSKDTILKDFTPGQRDYIIHTVYPIIKKALVHYVTEAALNHEIIERPDVQTPIAAKDKNPKQVSSQVFTVYSRVDLSGRKTVTKQAANKPASKLQQSQLKTTSALAPFKTSFSNKTLPSQLQQRNTQKLRPTSGVLKQPVRNSKHQRTLSAQQLLKKEELTSTTNLNHTGFEQKNDEKQSDAPQLNYGGFGQKKQVSPDEAPMQVKKSAFGEYTVTPTTAVKAFNREQQFKTSILAVINSKEENDRIFHTAAAGPPAAYLMQKRHSIFQKNVELKSIETFVAPKFPKSEEQTQQILNSMQDSFLTKHLDSKDHQTLADAMYAEHFANGSKIITYGDIGDKYYLLSSGKVMVKVYESGTDPASPTLEDKIIIQKQLSSDPTMIGFGEIALLQNDRRTASIIAIEDQGCDCWVLSADVFKHIIAQNNLRRRGLNLTYLNQVELFKGLETYEKLKIIDGLKIQTFKQGEFVFREGEVGNEFFIIEEGSCECLQGEEGAFQQVRNLSEGNHFGEVAIIKDVKRTLSVRALTEMRLLALSRDAFVRILGSIKEKLEDYLAEKNIKMMDISFESENSNKDVPEPVRPKHLEKTIKEVDETDD